MTRTALVLLLGLGAAAAAAHTHEPAAPPHVPTDAERAAFARARPVFARYCFKCHTTAGKKHSRTALRHLSMDGYPFGGHHAATVAAAIREVLGVGGEKPTMPDDAPGAVKGDDLATIAAWADAFDQARTATPAP
jgi:hypothetical protein